MSLKDKEIIMKVDYEYTEGIVKTKDVAFHVEKLKVKVTENTYTQSEILLEIHEIFGDLK